MLENAGSWGQLRKWAEGADSAVVDDDQLARLDVTQEGGADHVERDRLAGEYRRLAELAHHQWADAQRIAAGDQPFFGESNQRVGAFDLLESVGQAVEHVQPVG